MIKTSITKFQLNGHKCLLTLIYGSDAGYHWFRRWLSLFWFQGIHKIHKRASIVNHNNIDAFHGTRFKRSVIICNFIYTSQAHIQCVYHTQPYPPAPVTHYSTESSTESLAVFLCGRHAIYYAHNTTHITMTL